VDMQKPIVIKVSGHQLDDPVFLTAIAQYIRDLTVPIVVVHGGGAEITRMQQVMGIEPRYEDGLRVTDADSLAMVEMVLCGVVNKRLVRYLVHAGVDAIGLSGVDRGLVRGRKLAEHMAYTGTVTSVRGDWLLSLIDDGITPVVAPVCIGEDSNLNVNADTVAGAIAVAIGAAQMVFVSNVAGVLVDGKRAARLTVEDARRLIDDGTVFGGMIPKVTTALDILGAGIPEVVITDLDGLQTHGGTVFESGAAR